MAKNVHGTPVVPTENDPIRLARTYQHGLKSGLWRSLRGAIDILHNGGVPVSHSVLHRAVTVSRLPSDFLALFHEARPLTHAAVQEIDEIRLRDGVDELMRRAKAPSIDGVKSLRDLLDALAGPLPLKRNKQKTSQVARSSTDLPLPLAKIYAEGVCAGSWANRAAAARALGMTGWEVKLAVQIAALPSEITALFNRDDLTFWLGRQILSLASQKGIDSLVALAVEIPAEQRPLSVVDGMTLLKGMQIEADGINREILDLNLPLILAKEFAQGKEDGRWLTRRAAEKALGVRKDLVAAAVRIAELPQKVLSLFDAREINFSFGRKLLEIQKTVGSAAFLRFANQAAALQPQPTKKVIVQILSGTPITAPPLQMESVTVRFHAGRVRGGAHIRVSGPHIQLLAKHTKAIQNWCELLLKQETGAMPSLRKKR